MTREIIQRPCACAFGPDGCDTSTSDYVPCSLCGKPACDFHGDYPTEAHHDAGTWLCLDHQWADA
jgi:hypothetical protein